MRSTDFTTQRCCPLLKKHRWKGLKEATIEAESKCCQTVNKDPPPRVRAHQQKEYVIAKAAMKSVFGKKLTNMASI